MIYPYLTNFLTNGKYPFQFAKVFEEIKLRIKLRQKQVINLDKIQI